MTNRSNREDGGLMERPILFSAPMVRAILNGRKTVTRRFFQVTGPDGSRHNITSPREEVIRFDDGTFHYLSTAALSGPYPCPYGEPGDRLWVREAWRVPASLDNLSGRQIAEKCLDAGYRKPWCPTQYEADGTRTSQREWHEFGSKLGESTPGRYRHARFMPRWASRLTLEVTGVRVERLQDISEEDARAEGAPCELAVLDSVRLGARASHRAGFIRLWQSINGAGSWDANPWVWVVEFRRIEQEAHAHG